MSDRTMTGGARATRRQIEAALNTLALVSETEDLTGQDRDLIGEVRFVLDDLLSERGGVR